MVGSGQQTSFRSPVAWSGRGCMVRPVLLFLLILIAFAGLPVEGHARKVALVIGNGEYAHVSSLPNPPNDANATAEMFRRMGFDQVVQEMDTDRRTLVSALQSFASLASGAEMAAVYYAGHGIEVGGTNYLVPVDASLARDRDVEFEAIPLDMVMSAVEGATRFRMVVLDACRNNPFRARMIRTRGATRSVGRGLAEIEPPANTLVAYAARAGSEAADGEGRNSPFTQALLKYLPTPGVDVRILFGRVRDAVAAASDYGQMPHVYGSLGGDYFYLVPPQETQAGRTGAALDSAFWEMAERSSEKRYYELYLAQFPAGEHRAQAEQRIAALDANEREEALVTPLPDMGAIVEQREAAVKAPGTRFRDCPDCPEMVVVPGGTFRIGSPDDEAGRGRDEGPPRDLQMRSYAIGVFEVTFEEWAACVEDGGCDGYKPYDEGWGQGRLPVTNVNFKDAEAYARWLSGRTGERYRLPGEAEWEYAARGGTRTPYAFGSGIDSGEANFGYMLGRTTKVGSYAANAFGLFDMHGNVAEWVLDCWNGDYSGLAADGRAQTAGDCATRPMRGGSARNSASLLRSAARVPVSADARFTYTGFRVLRTLP